MKANDVGGDRLIGAFLSYISNDEDCIKPRQDRWLEVDLFRCMFQVIIPSLHRVSSRKYRCPRVEYSCDSCFSNWNSLLFHGFVNGNSVLWSHLVELIDADNSTISEYHSATFELEITGGSIFNDGCRKTSRAGALAWSVNRNWCYSFHKLKELRLGDWRVSQ